MQIVGMLEAEWSQVLWGSVSTGEKEDESSTGRVRAAGFHRVTTRSCLAQIFEIYEPFVSSISKFFWGGRGKLQVTETDDTEPVDTGAHQYCSLTIGPP
jgi:hypothetical protein